MSSLTTLGINKNKKGFAPTIQKRKPKARPSTAAAAAPSTTLASENNTIDESITSNYTIAESAKSPYASKQSPHHSRDNDLDDDLGLTQEEMEMNALISKKRRQTDMGNSSASIRRRSSAVPLPIGAPSPIAAPSPKSFIIDRPDCAFSGIDVPVLKTEQRTTPGLTNIRESMSRPLKEDEEDPVEVKERLAAAPASSAPSSPFVQRSPSPVRSPSPRPGPRSRSKKRSRRIEIDQAANESSPPPRPAQKTVSSKRQRVIEEEGDEDEEYELEASPSPTPAPALATLTRRNKGKQRAISEDEDYGKRKRTTKKPSVNKRATKSSRATTGSSIGIPSISSTSGVAISIGAPSKPSKSDQEESDMESLDDRPTFNGRKYPKKYAYRLPENLKTLDDITSDPARLDNLDKHMAMFTMDMDGIVSKSFKELETKRFNDRKRAEDAKTMSKEELAILKQKEEEERELLAKQKQMAKEKEEERRKREQEGQILAESSNALQVRLINGQIVLDTDSLTVERRGVEQDYGDGAMEVVEENAMSRKVNSMTYGKKQRSARWDEIETAEFYECISQFGTDFEMISMVMPGRTRSQIRLKYNREERLNPGKVTEYMIRKKKPVDLKRYEEMAGVELEGVPDDFHEMELV